MGPTILSYKQINNPSPKNKNNLIKIIWEPTTQVGIWLRLNITVNHSVAIVNWKMYNDIHGMSMTYIIAYIHTYCKHLVRFEKKHPRGNQFQSQSYLELWVHGWINLTGFTLELPTWGKTGMVSKMGNRKNHHGDGWWVGLGDDEWWWWWWWCVCVCVRVCVCVWGGWGGVGGGGGGGGVGGGGGGG